MVQIQTERWRTEVRMMYKMRLHLVDITDAGSGGTYAWISFALALAVLGQRSSLD